MMKKWIYLLVVGALAACNIIPENERIEDLTVIEPKKRVLLQEFTGMRCINCPNAAEVAHNLQESYGNNVVVVALHPQGISWTDPGTIGVDLRSQVATDYFTFAGGTVSTSLPTGMIDLTKHDDKLLQDYNNWTGLVNVHFAQEPMADLLMTCTADSTARTISWSANVTASHDLSNTNLLVLLTESNIVGAQQMPDGSLNREYVHNHVLRAALNNTWGQPINTLQPNDSQLLEATYMVENAAWKLANCTLVGIILKADTKEVLNVLEIPLYE